MLYFTDIKWIDIYLVRKVVKWIDKKIDRYIYVYRVVQKKFMMWSRGKVLEKF